MPNLTGLTTNFFPTPNEGFTTTTSGSIDSSTDTTIGLNSVSGLTDGSIFTGLIDPGNAKERAFTGVVDTSGSQITNVVFTTGSNATHTAGATVVDYVTGTHIAQMTKGIQKEHNQDGTHGDITATSITTNSLTLSGQSNDGWLATGGTHSVSTGYNAGNRSFTINTSTDLSSIVSNGMRYRVTRGTTPPTQCADLEASSSHYASKSSPTGITFTDDFTCEAWIKLESYFSTMSIISRFNGTSGWDFSIGSSGQLRLYGFNAGGGNYRGVESYQSIPLGKWVHVVAHLDMSGSNDKILIDGVNVPATTYTAGTNPTALVQAGNLELGSRNGGTLPLDGKLADVRVWSDLRTDTEIQDNMYAYPSDTTGLVAHFKLNGDFTDASANGNDLTAQNSAVATNVDNPWNATEYGVITNVTTTTLQIFCPIGYGIPNEALSAPYYSTQDAPYGFPRDKGLWSVEWLDTGTGLQATPTANVLYNSNFGKLTVPIGAWDIFYHFLIDAKDTTVTSIRVFATLSSNSSAEDNIDAKVGAFTQGASATMEHLSPTSKNIYRELTTATPYYSLIFTTQSGYDQIGIRGDFGTTIIRATCAYI